MSFCKTECRNRWLSEKRVMQKLFYTLGCLCIYEVRRVENSKVVHSHNLLCCISSFTSN
jgi:hypothetical protein